MKARGSSVSTFRIVAVLVILLGVLIVAALMFAPRKVAAPPASTVAYQERPDKTLDESFDPTLPAAPNLDIAARRQSSEPETPPEAAPTPETPQAEFVIRGRITDARAGNPLQGVAVEARRNWTGHEQSDWRARHVQALRARDGAILAELRELEEKLRFAARGSTTDTGDYEIRVTEPGIYAVTITLRGYLPITREADELNPDNPEAVLDAALSTGAAIAGRVVEAGTGRGAPNVAVLVEGFPLPPAITDDEGEYILEGLAVGEFGVTLELRDTPYRTTDVLPYQKVKISTPDQNLQNVNFTVEPAGVIWGYVQNVDRKPVAGSQVILCTSSSVVAQALTAMVKRAPPIRDSSEEDGYYELLGVPLNDRWRVYVTSSDYAPQISQELVLTSTAREVQVDVFVANGSTVAGRVVEPDGRAIPEANVLCMPAYTSLFSPMNSAQAFRNANTDENGFYSIPELPAGDYQVMGRKNGYKFAALGEPVFSDGMNLIEGVDVVLYPVETGNHSIFGIVTDSANAPMSGVSVRLNGLRSESLSDAGEETSTGTDGRFEFANVERGLYILTATKDGYGQQTIRNVLLDKEIHVKLDATAVVRGKVLIKDTEEAPREYSVSATLMTSREATGENLMRIFEPPEEITFNDPTGFFELQLQPGAYRIEGSAPQYTPGRQLVDLEAGQVVEDVILYVRKEGGRIEGRVVTADNQSPQGAEVSLVDADSPAEAAEGMMGGDGGARTMRVGTDGVFVFENLPEGTYIVVARHERYTTARSESLVLEDLGNLTGIEVRLTFGGSIDGYVAINGRRVAGAIVTALGSGEPRVTETDENGYFRIDALAPGSYGVTAVPFSSEDPSAALDMRMRQADVQEGTTTTVNFEEEFGATIEGMCVPPPPSIGGLLPGGFAALRYPGTSPLPLGASVGLAALSQDFFQLPGGVIDSTGFFVIEGIPPGSYQIDIYYAFGMELRYVSATLIEVAGEESIPVEIAVDMF